MGACGYSLTEGVATLTLDDGKVNAVTLDTVQSISESLDRALADAAIVLLRGRPGFFSAGFDLKYMAQGPEQAMELTGAGARLVARMLEHPHPIVSVCTGHAYPMGAFMLMASDYVIGEEGDFRLGLNEVTIGLTLPQFAIELARYRLGDNAIRRLSLTGEMLSPDHALSLGLLDELVANEEADAALEQRVESFRQVDHTAFQETKQKLHHEFLQRLDAAISSEFGKPEAA